MTEPAMKLQQGNCPFQVLGWILIKWCMAML